MRICNRNGCDRSQLTKAQAGQRTSIRFGLGISLGKDWDVDWDFGGAENYMGEAAMGWPPVHCSLLSLCLPWGRDVSNQHVQVT